MCQSRFSILHNIKLTLTKRPKLLKFCLGGKISQNLVTLLASRHHQCVKPFKFRKLSRQFSAQNFISQKRRPLFEKFSLNIKFIWINTSPTLLPTYLPSYLPINLPNYIATKLYTYQTICLPNYIPTKLYTYQTIYLPNYIPTKLYIYQTIYLPNYIPTKLYSTS